MGVTMALKGVYGTIMRCLVMLMSSDVHSRSIQVSAPDYLGTVVEYKYLDDIGVGFRGTEAVIEQMDNKCGYGKWSTLSVSGSDIKYVCVENKISNDSLELLPYSILGSN